MQIRLVTPASGSSRGGNRVTALRWTRILRGLGHTVAVETEYQGGRCDALIALHARRSFASVERFHHDYPGRALIVALTGTDLYGDLRRDAQARRSLDLATRLVLLQPLGLEELPDTARAKTRVIYQSATPPPGRPRPDARVFEVCVLGHLRAVKDPLRAATAARLLPASSRVRITHVGAALTPEMQTAARAEAAANPRYRWLGELPRWKGLRILSRSRALVLSSEMEGGANVISEAVVAGVPVLASRIPGSIGLLGEAYPGYFPVGDTAALAALLGRAETDREFYGGLRAWCAQRAPLFDPERERLAWQRLLYEAAVPMPAVESPA
ncbi:MAG TPA: selenoneine biosynthesis selenosugar synthase SenB [bacterium]|nr:selenoneine biosynthesis selenosugar synthase SenB [bacterium]